jgi:RHS repeat-associated protein
VPSTSALYFVHTSQQGTPLMVSDSNENIVWSTTYQPYGTTPTIVSSIAQNLRFPGQFSDLETGFHYNLNRDYMPNLGRYLEADPIGLAAGLNPYLYASGNPVKNTDRFGLDDSNNNTSAAQNDNGPGIVVSVGYCYGVICVGANVTNPASTSPNVYPTVGLGIPPGPYSNAVAATNAHNYATGLSATIAPPGIDAFGCSQGACAGGFQPSVKPNACVSYGFTNWNPLPDGAPQPIPNAIPMIWQRNDGIGKPDQVIPVM